MAAALHDIDVDEHAFANELLSECSAAARWA